MQLSDELVTQQTLMWVNSFIVELNVCPFARRELEKNRVKVCVVRSKKIEIALEELMTEVQWLDQHTETETTLVVFPTLFRDFHRYLDFIDLAENLLFEKGYEGIYQVATFHPDYCFADAEPDDVSNYTNRSPYPMIHLLRESSVEKAIEFYGETQEIPENNIKLMESMGTDKVQAILTAVMSIKNEN